MEVEESGIGIMWMPVADMTDRAIDYMPLTTFETGQHTEDQGVPVPEAGGPLSIRT
jgi:hypothetical protein